MPFNLIKPNPNFDFVKTSPFFTAISLVFIAISFWGMFTKGFNYGIDFTGGQIVQIKYKNATSIDEVRKIVDSLGTEAATVVQLGEEGKEFLITARSAEAVKKSLADQILEKVGAENVEIEKSDSVGPKVGAELRQSALLSLLYSILFIMIYIWFRFDLKFAPGATIAMIHDIILAAGYYIFSGAEFTITSVAALLTIAGYSVNDTIIIYDRARENVKGGESGDLKTTINKAINQTLSRTLITSFLTLLSTIALALLTTGEIREFANALIIGILVGSYSTMFIAAPFTIIAQKFVSKKHV